MAQLEVGVVGSASATQPRHAETPDAICFDMAFTLLRHRLGGPGWLGPILAEFGYSYSAAHIEAAHAPARELYIRATREGRDFEASMDQALAFWGEYNALVLAHLGIPPDQHDEIAGRIHRDAWDPAGWEIYPEVVDTLRELRRRGIRLAVVSNFIDTLHAVCDASGIVDYFDTIVCSVEVGAMKPDPRIFEIALRRLGSTPATTWHVGDNYWADVLGARAAGMRPVLVDRAGTTPRPDCAVVRGIDGVIDLLDGG